MITKFIYAKPSDPRRAYVSAQLSKPEEPVEFDGAPIASLAIYAQSCQVNVFARGPEEILELEAQLRAIADGIREFYRPEVKHDASTEI